MTLDGNCILPELGGIWKEVDVREGDAAGGLPQPWPGGGRFRSPPPPQSYSLTPPWKYRDIMVSSQNTYLGPMRLRIDIKLTL